MITNYLTKNSLHLMFEVFPAVLSPIQRFQYHLYQDKLILLMVLYLAQKFYNHTNITLIMLISEWYQVFK